MKQSEEKIVDRNGSPPDSREPSSDPRLARAMEEYQALLNAGQKPDHAEFLARHPEVGAALADGLVGLDFLHAAAPHLSTPAPAGDSAPGLEAGATLGDFRLIREVGRGGMGVVYEAEQISLSRRVALKVLPLAATMDPRHLQRFHNEARAAASLHHSNIVPVHGVGCERGVHYFSMQFIEGRTLAEVVAQQRGASTANLPTADEHQVASSTQMIPATQVTSSAPRDKAYFRRVTDWAIQAAEALDYAHTLGVVHRDVKPANLMVDTTGRLWVTDFGLAQVQSDVRLTTTGGLVGTLRYMSPEQALAQRVVIDQRTDVYSLGATFYELLTLQPIFTGNDRQELLRQLAFDEPRRPRRLNRAIPTELETIVLKALEKKPQDRYTTARDFADDLHRYLEDRPIQARRPSWRQVATRWARRHRTVVWSVVALLLMTTVLGGVAGLWWVRTRASAEGEARALLQEAQGLEQEEKWSEALNAVRHAQLLLTGIGADPNLRQQAQELGRDVEMARRLEEARLQMAVAKGRQFDAGRATGAFAEAFQWYGLDLENIDPREAAERISKCSIRTQLVVAMDEWALHIRMGEITTWQRFVAIARLADPDPLRNRLRDVLTTSDANALDEMIAAADSDELSPATALFMARLATKTALADRLLGTLRRVQQRHPDDFWVNEHLGHRLGFSQPADPQGAIRYLSIAVALRPQSPGARYNLGMVLEENGQVSDAIAEYREACRLKMDYAEAHCGLGSALDRNGQPEQAMEEFRKAIDLNKEFALPHNRLGHCLADKGEWKEALREFREAVRIDPKEHRYHYNLGLALRNLGQLDEALKEYHVAIDLKKDFAEAYNNIGTILHEDKKDLDKAIEAYRQAVYFAPEDDRWHYNLALALGDRGWPAEAVKQLREAIRCNPKNADAHDELVAYLADMGDLNGAIAVYRDALKISGQAHILHCKLALLLEKQNRWDEAIAELRQAIVLKAEYAEAHNILGAILVNKDQLEEGVKELCFAIEHNPDGFGAYLNLGHAKLRQGHFGEAVRLIRRGQQLAARNGEGPLPAAQEELREAERLAALDVRLAKVLEGRATAMDAVENIAFAKLCQEPYRQQHAKAARFYAAAFAQEPALAEARQPGHRLYAAYAAASAGCGQGKGQESLTETDRAALRQQALDWLRADLIAWRQCLDKDPETARQIVAILKDWQRHSQLAGVRAQGALSKLPEAERKSWRLLWSDVGELLAQAEKNLEPNKQP
jgi:serine/threonine protein kinase/Flp pilus assembly protein TadD